MEIQLSLFYLFEVEYVICTDLPQGKCDFLTSLIMDKHVRVQINFSNLQ